MDDQDWLHLKPYGYAPGHYMNRCRFCNKVVEGVDKRAITCRPCAEASRAAFDAKVRTVGYVDRVTGERIYDPERLTHGVPVVPTGERWCMCNDCGTWKQMQDGNHHPWCHCGSDNFRWEDERDRNPEGTPGVTGGGDGL